MKLFLCVAILTAGMTLTSLAKADFGISDLESAAKSATSGSGASGGTGASSQDPQSLMKKISDKAVVHLNSASESDLAKLPGIGPTQAQAIIKARPFNSVQDLSKVPGLKEAAVSKLKGLVAL